MKIGDDFNDLYIEILKDIYYKGDQCKPRQMVIKELTPYDFCLTDPNKNVVYWTEVKTNLDYAKEELKWYMSGTNNIDWSEKIHRVWSKYSDDGKTVNSGYGKYIFGIDPQLGQSQFDWCIDKLESDHDTRQAVISINQPYHKKRFDTKDFPCTMYMQFQIRRGKLDLHVNMRSNDVFLGLRNDLYCFTEIQKTMNEVLKTQIGRYYHHTTSMHSYKHDWDKITSTIREYELNELDEYERIR